MTSAVIAGASGLVGGRCLHHLLEQPQIARVTALVRTQLSLTNAKLEQRVVTFPAVIDAVPKDVDAAFCALGTTIKKAGSREGFAAVDKDAVLAFARASRTRGARCFVLVSSVGADPRSMNFYLRIKGEVEHDVSALGFETLHILRPSVLDGERAESRPAERISIAVLRKVSGVLGTGFKYAPIHVDVVGKAMVKLALSTARGVTVHESPALHALG